MEKDMTSDRTISQDEENTETTKKNDRGSSYMQVSQATLEPDWFLRKLVSFANSLGVETPVTLLVGGTQVTGTVISGEKYFNLTSEEFGGAFKDGELGDKFKTMLNGFAETMRGDPNDTQRPEPTYIHLHNAHFYIPGGNIPRNQGNPILWRARISSIDGFFIGSTASTLHSSKTD